MTSCPNRERGFTLMELLIVIAIMGILASVGLGNFTYSMKKGRDAQRKSDLGQISRALEAYANDNKGAYPADDTVIPWNAQWKRGNSIYMTKVPTDPMNGYKYYYEKVDSGDGYVLYSTLENTSDAYYKVGGWPDTNCGTVLCYFKLSAGGAEK